VGGKLCLRDVGRTPDLKDKKNRMERPSMGGVFFDTETKRREVAIPALLWGKGIGISRCRQDNRKEQNGKLLDEEAIMTKHSLSREWTPMKEKKGGDGAKLNE